MLEGIEEMFREYSEADEFVAQAQLEFFWALKLEAKREHNEMSRNAKQAYDLKRRLRPERVVYLRDWHRARRNRLKPGKRSYRCSSCGGMGHNARACERQQARAA